MKYRNKKAIATLIVTTLIFTCGATGVQAAPAADQNPRQDGRLIFVTAASIARLRECV